MTLQAKLTLGTVVLATVIVAINSAVYLGSIMDLQFESALRTALRVGDTALRHVVDAGNSRPDLSLSDALTNDRLTERLETEVALDNEIVEVAVVDATSGEILADNFPDRRGLQLHQPIESLEHLAHASWRQKLRVLLSHNIEHYEVERKMGPPPISVRVVVQPATIRDSMQPAIDRSAHIALLSVIGAIGLTFTLLRRSRFVCWAGCAVNSTCSPAENPRRKRPAPSPHGTRSPSCRPRSACWANVCAAHSTMYPICAAISIGCCRISRTPF